MWAYPILVAVAAGDAVFPILPSETIAIICGIQAARGELSLGWVLALAAAGAFSGDNASYSIGRFAGAPAARRLFRGEKAKERVERAREFLSKRGSYVLVVARFVPGGRTATTFTAGLVHVAWMRRFAPLIALAAVLWSLYSVFLGYLGGKLFRDKPLYAVILALGVALAITAAVEGGRRVFAARS
jgi:membrane protein DedA with SNARE-associated domain